MTDKEKRREHWIEMTGLPPTDERPPAGCPKEEEDTFTNMECLDLGVKRGWLSGSRKRAHRSETECDSPWNENVVKDMEE